MTGIATEEFKMTELGPIPCYWEIGMLGSGRYFQILPSGIDNFTGQKKYLSTSSIQGWKIESPECLIYYGNRPSRANMQPRLNTVWFAKMIGTVKVYCFTESNREEVTEYILSTGFCGIRCKEDVDTEYLKFIFLSDYFNTLKDSLCSGATQRAINNDSISSITIAFPPLPEQKKIAHMLSTVQTAIEKTEAVIKATRALKKSLMKHLFTYGPVSIDEAKNVPLKETEIGMIPEEWETVRLGLVSTISTGTTPSTKRADYYCGEVPFIKTSEISNNVIDKAINHISDEAVRDYNLRIYGIGTVFLAMYGQGKTRGQAALLNIAATTTQNTAAIVPNGMLKAEYLWHYLMSRYEFLRSQGFQGQISHLNLGHVKQIMIPLPALRIQEQIIDILDSLQRRAETEENKRQALEALFRTLLSRLMIGKIRVDNLEVPV